jgi:hypothetical protein
MLRRREAFCICRAEPIYIMGGYIEYFGHEQDTKTRIDIDIDDIT